MSYWSFFPLEPEIVVRVELFLQISRENLLNSLYVQTICKLQKKTAKIKRCIFHT